MTLLSHRPSVLYKVEHMATEPVEGDIAVEGLKLAGPGWEDRLKELLGALSQSERACLFAVKHRRRAGAADARRDAAGPPPHRLVPRVPLARADDARTSSRSSTSTPARAFGREALMRGKLGAVEVRGGELLAAAEAHDALFSFDARARAAALEVGMPLLPEGEVLFVNLDPRACLDVESSVRTTWPVVARLGTDPGRICIEIVRPERCPDRELLQATWSRRTASAARWCRSTTSPAAAPRSPAWRCFAPTSRRSTAR